MSAFDSGFRMGMGAFQQAIENKQREEELGWKRADRARTDKQNQEIDAETANLKAMLSPSAVLAQQGLGLSGDGKSADAAPVVSPIAAKGLGAASAADTSATGGLGANMPSVQDVAGSAPPVSNAGQSVASTGLRTFSDLDRLRGMQRVALASRDMPTVERLGGQIKKAEEDEIISSALKNYTGGEDQIGATAQHLNSTSKSIAMSDPDKNGVVRMSVVTPDRRAQFLDLSRQDQARLYAAAQLMERNPSKAYEMMSGVNKTLADAIVAENGLTAKVVNSNNDAAFKGRDDDRADMQLAEISRHNRASESIAATRVHAASSTGNVSREERMRYTSLLGETSRRLTESQKTLATLQKDPLYSMAKPGSPQQIELQGLKDSIATLSEERKTYQGLLAAPQAGEKAAARQDVSAKSSAIQALPDGAKQIGTSGGRPVYELPDGRRVISR